MIVSCEITIVMLRRCVFLTVYCVENLKLNTIARERKKETEGRAEKLRKNFKIILLLQQQSGAISEEE